MNSLVKQLLLTIFVLSLAAPAAFADTRSDALAQFDKNSMAGMLSMNDDLPKALSYCNANVKLAKEKLPDRIAIAYNNLALLYRVHNDYANAAINSALKIEYLKKAVPPDYKEMCDTYNGLGMCYSKINRNDDAVAAYRNGVAAAEKLPPVKPTEMSWVKRSLNYLAEELRRQNRTAEAAQVTARANAVVGIDPR